MKWLNNLLKDAPVESAVEATSPPIFEPDLEERLPSPGAMDAATSAPPLADEPVATVPPEPTPAVSAPEPEPVAPPIGAPPDAAALRKLDELLQTQRELQQLFASRIHSDEVQAKALERLHDELRQYKTNFIRQQLLPFFKDVIFCHDFLCGELDRLHAADSVTDSESSSRTLDHARQMLVDLLFKYDIEPYRGAGEQFDPKSQQCARTVPTDTAEQDKKIAAQLLPGFKSPDSIVRREQVVVFKHRPVTE